MIASARIVLPLIAMAQASSLAASDAPAGPQNAHPPSPRLYFDQSHSATLTAAGRRFKVNSLLAVDRPMRYGDSTWNDAEISGGMLWIRVDLRRQIMSVFRGGNEIGTTVILYGADTKPTPVGRFSILAMARHHRSSLYDAEMPFTLRLTNDGVSIHGSNVRERAATHGCIGVPYDFARHLFDVAKVGDIVTVE